MAGCGRHTDWAIGIGEAERFSIMADAKYNGKVATPGCQIGFTWMKPLWQTAKSEKQSADAILDTSLTSQAYR